MNLVRLEEDIAPFGGDHRSTNGVIDIGVIIETFKIGMNYPTVE